MRRRDFIKVITGSAAAWPLTARAQQSRKVARIGVLMGGVATDPSQKANIAGLMQGLQKLGWVDGSNVLIDYRFGSGDANKMRAFAKELGSGLTT